MQTTVIWYEKQQNKRDRVINCTLKCSSLPGGWFPSAQPQFAATVGSLNVVQCLDRLPATHTHMSLFGTSALYYETA